MDLKQEINSLYASLRTPEERTERALRGNITIRFDCDCQINKEIYPDFALT